MGCRDCDGFVYCFPYCPKEVANPHGDRRPDHTYCCNEVQSLKAALREANEMVVRHTMPFGWDKFQEKHGLHSAEEVLRSANAKDRGPDGGR